MRGPRRLRRLGPYACTCCGDADVFESHSTTQPHLSNLIRSVLSSAKGWFRAYRTSLYTAHTSSTTTSPEAQKEAPGLAEWARENQWECLGHLRHGDLRPCARAMRSAGHDPVALLEVVARMGCDQEGALRDWPSVQASLEA